MIAYTCDNAQGRHGGLCIRFMAGKDEAGHFVHVVTSPTDQVIRRDGYWTFYIGGAPNSEHNLDSLNAA